MLPWLVSAHFFSSQKFFPNNLSDRMFSCKPQGKTISYVVNNNIINFDLKKKKIHSPL